MWLVCFNTQYELQKVVTALGKILRKEFQIDIQIGEVTHDLTKEKAHKALELGNWFRFD